MSSADNFQTLPLETEADFLEMMTACWEAFETPFEPFLRVVFYLSGPTPEDRRQSIQAAATMMKALQDMSPNSHWIKVIDTATGKLVGAANWVVHKEDPYAGKEESGPVVAFWWPEGEGRNYASKFLQQVEDAKRRLYNRAHICK